MFLEKIKSEGLAHLSYILGDGERAAVIDPRRDCEIYLDIAYREGARITHIFETHRNEDYVIGSCELAERTGATIYHGAELPFEYGETAKEGDRFSFGNLTLNVLCTPGHTFESLSFVLSDEEFSEEPLAVFSGDALFIGDVGRTDFFPDQAEKVAGLLYDSLFDKLLPLGDHVLLYPAHGAGSVCGSGMASREFSTVGYERKHNPSLQVASRDEFIQMKMAEKHTLPPYFKKMEEFNLAGPVLLGNLPRPEPCDADEFARAMENGMLAIDVRSPEAFAGAYIPGSLAIPLNMLPAYAGWFVPHDRDLGLILSRGSDWEMAARHLVRLGYDRLIAMLDQGMHEWETSGRQYDRIPAVHAGELKRRLDENQEFTLLDVRKPDEIDGGILPGSTTIFLGDLPHKLDKIPRQRPITTFCGSGRRAIIAASILKNKGFENVEDCLGSMAACQALGCELTSK